MNLLLIVLSALASLSLLVNYRLFGALIGAGNDRKLLAAENEQLTESLLDSFESDGRPRHRWKKESETTQTLSLVRRQEDVLVTEVCQHCRMVHRYWKHGIANCDEDYHRIEGFFVGAERINDNYKAAFCTVAELKALPPASK